MLSSKQIVTFQQKILDWYKKNKRNLPWRQDRNPYHILISEVMLQQTQVQRVIPKYEAWMKVFPTVQSLAKASTQQVLLHWSGLGYNRRALFLQKFAKEIVEKYDGKIPQDKKILMGLPGIGEYTAAALLCFAFDKQVAVVDTNIRKVILVHFPQLTEDLDKKKENEVVSKIANTLLSEGQAYAWNQALMDYASAELKKEKISIPKQSQFKDSDRYYRGQIIKFLTTNKKLFITDLQKNFPSLQKERLERIIESLIKDNFIQKKQDYILLSV